MNLQEVIEHFGSGSALARALGIKPAAVFQWKGEIPLLRQYQIERITEGKFKPESHAA